MFQSARIQLTAWYLLIITIVCLLFSLTIFTGINRELIRMKHTQEKRIERIQEKLIPPRALNRQPPAIELEEINALQKTLKVILIVVNSIILILSGIAAYFLAGKTLEPIKEMVDKQHRFITDASHELRTPLTALKTSIEVHLRDSNLSLKEAKDLLEDNLKDINTLKNLSDNLLLLSSVQHKKPHFQKISLSKVLSDAIHKTSHAAHNKKIIIEKSLEEISIKANLERIQELFIIFLDNAIKYSPEKSTISLITEKKDSYGYIHIKDQGIGISEKDIPYIFERFYRADISRTNSTKDGYGLGLSIAKEIIDAHNGEINVTSSMQKGTQFTIKLPLA